MKGEKVAKFQKDDARVFASGNPGNPMLACQTHNGHECPHKLMLAEFLASGLQHIGMRFKIYPATLKYLKASADKENAKVILGEIKARKANVEPTIKAKVLPSLSKPEPVKPAPQAAKPEAPPVPNSDKALIELAQKTGNMAIELD